MKKKLSDWASIAEIIGTLAIVVSLLLVVRSVDQNSRVIAAGEANNIWQAWRQVAVLPIISGGELAAVKSKVLNSESLSNVEEVQWDAYLSGQIDIFAQLFDRHNSGLISPDYWSYWDNGFWVDWDENDFARIYESNREYFDPAFREYVDTQVIERGLAER